jgi:hypothetical protein
LILKQMNLPTLSSVTVVDGALVSLKRRASHRGVDETKRISGRSPRLIVVRCVGRRYPSRRHDLVRRVPVRGCDRQALPLPIGADVAAKGFGFARSRWAAVSAAVAVTIGIGGLGVAHAVTTGGTPSAFVPVTPCRLFDTCSGRRWGREPGRWQLRRRSCSR